MGPHGGERAKLHASSVYATILVASAAAALEDGRHPVGKRLRTHTRSLWTAEKGDASRPPEESRPFGGAAAEAGREGKCNRPVVVRNTQREKEASKKRNLRIWQGISHPLRINKVYRI